MASFTFFKFFQYSTIQLLVNIPTQGEFGFLTKMDYFRALLNCATIHGHTQPSTTNYNHPQLAIILQPQPMNHQLFHHYHLQLRTLLKNAPFQNYFFNDLAQINRTCVFIGKSIDWFLWKQLVTDVPWSELFLKIKKEVAASSVIPSETVIIGLSNRLQLDSNPQPHSSCSFMN